MMTFGLAFLINVLLTHYSVDNNVYGMYKYATNFILTIPSIFSFGITWSCASLIAQDTKLNKNGIITASVLLTSLIGIIVTFCMFIIYGVSIYLEKPIFENAIIVFPFIVVFLLQKLIDQIYTGSGEPLKLSIYNIAPNLILFTGILINILLFNKISYIYSITLYLLSFTVVIIPKLIGIKYEFIDFNFSLRILLRDVFKNGLKVHISSIFTTSSTQIIALVCGNLFGYAEYGYYSLAASLAIIFQMIGGSLAIVNFKHYANTDRIPTKDFMFTFGIGLGAYILMILTIDSIFSWFYPQSYVATIFYLKLLCLSNLIYGFSNLFNRFFIGKGLGGIIMKNSFVTAISTIIIYIPLINKLGMKGMAFGSIIVSMICMLYYFFDYRKFQKQLKDQIL